MAVQTKLFLHATPPGSTALEDALSRWEGVAPLRIKVPTTPMDGGIEQIGDTCHVFDGKLFLANPHPGRTEIVESALADCMVDFGETCKPAEEFSTTARLSMRDVIEIPRISGKALVLVSKTCGTNEEGIEALRAALEKQRVVAEVQSLEVRDSPHSLGAMSAITPIGYDRVIYQPKVLSGSMLRKLGLQAIDCDGNDVYGASGLMMRNYANPTTRLILHHSCKKTIEKLRQSDDINLIVEEIAWDGTADLASIYVECNVD